LASCSPKDSMLIRQLNNSMTIMAAVNLILSRSRRIQTSKRASPGTTTANILAVDDRARLAAIHNTLQHRHIRVWTCVA
jgi:hypothetical protein